MYGNYYGQTYYGQLNSSVVRPYSITKASSYVIKISTGTTKSLQYYVGEQGQFSKSLAYVVKASIDIEKSLKYTIPTTQISTNSLSYEVRGSIPVSIETTYSLATNPKYSKSLGYFITEVLEITKPLEYVVKRTPNPSKSLKYTLFTYSSKIKGLEYRIVQEISPELDLGYEVTTGKFAHARYVIKRIPIFEKEEAYRIKTIHSFSKTVRYQLKWEREAIKLNIYRVNTIHNTELDLRVGWHTGKFAHNKYAIRLSINRSKSNKYGIRTTSSQSKSLGYALILTPPVIKIVNNKYTVLTTASETKDLRVGWHTGKFAHNKYTIKTNIRVNKGAQYRVTGFEKQTKALFYKIKEPVVIQKTFRHRYLFPNILKNKSVSYNIRPGKFKQLSYNHTWNVNIQKNSRYIIRNTKPITKGLQYEVYYIGVRIYQPLRYVLHATIAKQRTLQYALWRPTVTTSVFSEYVIKRQPNPAKPNKYTVRYSPTSKFKDIFYYVSTQKSRTKALSYIIKKVTPIQKSLEYRFYLSVFTKYLYSEYRISAEEVKVKSVEYKVIPSKSKALSVKYVVKKEGFGISKQMTYNVDKYNAIRGAYFLMLFKL